MTCNVVSCFSCCLPLLTFPPTHPKISGLFGYRMYSLQASYCNTSSLVLIIHSCEVVWVIIVWLRMVRRGGRLGMDPSGVRVRSCKTFLYIICQNCRNFWPKTISQKLVDLINCSEYSITPHPPTHPFPPLLSNTNVSLWPNLGLFART